MHSTLDMREEALPIVVGAPGSCSFKIPMTCCSENRLRYIRPSSNGSVST